MKGKNSLVAAILAFCLLFAFVGQTAASLRARRFRP